MNLEKLVVDFFEEEESIEAVGNIKTVQDYLAHLRKCLEAVRELKQVAAFKKFKVLVVDPALKTIEHRLKKERDEVEIHIMQGSAIVLEKYFDIATFEKFFDVEMQKAKGRLEELKNKDKSNAEEENR